MENRTKFGLLGVAAAGAGAAGGWTALGTYLYNRVNNPPARDPDREDANPYQTEGRLWARAREGFREISIHASDNVPLWAAVVPAAEGEHRWAICVHGYADTYEAMGAIAKHYHEAGWNVLLPDQRRHGRSGGGYVGWGYNERLDLLGWISWILRRDTAAEIVLHGCSMGGATVLMATGGPLPRQVKAAISDCSYTSCEAEVLHLVHHGAKEFVANIPAPAGILFKALRKTTLRKDGLDLRDASPLDAVSKSKTPTLFIHGDKDDFVPSAMMGKLYQAAKCPKNFLWVPEAGHVQAVGTDPDLYWEAVRNFLVPYVKPDL